MARLAAVEKGLYYPTPLRIVDLIKNHIHLYRPGGLIFDPFIGKGEAVHKLAELMGQEWRVCGIELEHERAETAERLIGEGSVMQGDASEVIIEGACDILYFNPPYDYVNGERLEIKFLRSLLQYQTLGGLLIAIIPEVIIKDDRFSDELKQILMAHKASSVKVFKFPEPEYQPFKQVVLFARKSDGMYASEPDLKIQAELGLTPSIEGLRASDPRYHYFYNIINPLSSQGQNEITLSMPQQAGRSTPLAASMASKGVLDYLGMPDRPPFELTPLMPITDEHAVLVAAAGMLNGVTIDNKVFRGSTYKVKKIKEKETKNERGDKITETTEIEVIVARLTWLDLETGKIDTCNNDQHQYRFSKIITSNGPAFVKAAKSLYPSIFGENEEERYDFSHISSPVKLPGQPDGLLPPQKKVAAGLLKAWRERNVALLVGEMGTGKTTTSLALASTFALTRKPECQKIIILTPPKDDLLKKWVAEAKAVLRKIRGPLGEEPYVCSVESISQVQEAFERKGLVVIVMKETTAKDSSPWKPVSPMVKYHYEKFAPNGDFKEKPGTPIKSLKRILDMNKSHLLQFNTGVTKVIQAKPIYICPQCWKRAHPPSKAGGRWVHHCGEAFWTFTHRPKPSGGHYAPKYPLAKFIRERYAGQYQLVVDEAHNFKGGDTNRGYASADLISGAYKTLLMTGTIFGGLASSLFYILYRTLPDFRKLYEHRDEQSFINDHGLFEEITRKYPTYNGDRISGYAEYTSNPSERPGMDPGMVAWLLPCTAFLALRDFDIIMPPYSEHTFFVKPNEELKAIETYLENLKKEGVEQWTKHEDKSVLSQWMWARYGVWDRPLTMETIAGVHYVPPEVPAGWMSRKEEAFIRLVYSHKQRRRKVLCYVQQINRRDPTPRLIQLLAQYGMKGRTMYQGEKKRTRFIRQAIADGCDVIFTNDALVAEGINIPECPTIIWYQHDFNAYRMPQANRRSYRFGQQHPVEIIYLAFLDTPQYDAFSRIAEKIAAQQAIQGDIRNGLAALEAEDDFVSELQEAISDQNHHESSLHLWDFPRLSEILAEVKKKHQPEPEPTGKPITIFETASGQKGFF